MTTTTTPALTLKSLKLNLTFSRETYCFTTKIYANGKDVAYAENDGHGGCTFVTLSPEGIRLGLDRKAIEEKVDELVDEAATAKETAKVVAKVRRDAVKNAHYIKTTTQKGFVSLFKGVTDLNREKAVAQAKAHPEFKTMVADMSDADIIAWFIA